MKISSSYTVGSNPSVNPTANTAYGDGFTALPSGLNYFIVFGQGGATITWDGGGTGNSWFTAANWSGDAVPGLGDFVQVTGANTIDIDAGTATVSTLTLGDGANQAVLNISSGTDVLEVYSSSANALTVASNSVININNDSGIIFDPTGSAGYDSSLTTFASGSIIEHQTGSVDADIYGNLIINGATGTTGDLIVENMLEKAKCNCIFLNR